MRIWTMMLVALLLAGLAGCAPGPEERDGDRVVALEAEVAALRQEMRARDEALRGELAVIRQNLDGVREALRAGAGLPGKAETGTAKAAPDTDAPLPPEGGDKRDALDDELDVKAKTFVRDSLDRLLAITRKLLDRMDSELEKRNDPSDGKSPAPDGTQGDRI